MSEPEGRGGAWTEEREARNERRATREGAASKRPDGERETLREPATEQGAEAAEQAPPPRKRSILRRLLSSVLVFEAIILVLAVPVAVTIEHLNHGVAFGVGGGLALLAFLLAGVVGRGRWALIAGTVLQFLIIAAGIEVPALYVLGVVFCVLWFGGIHLANKIEPPNPG
jgi:hypothetical protein